MSMVWQIAAGDYGRDYSEELIKHDVMIMGPGECGDLNDDLGKYEAAVAEGRWSARQFGATKRFHREVKPGHIVLLRRGYRVCAIGLIHEEGYKWDTRFDDVYGWDLSHTRRVVWQHQLMAELDRIQRGGELFQGRKQIPTFTRVKDEKVLKPINDLLTQCKSRGLATLPERPGDEESDDGVGNELFARGLSLTAVDDLLKAIARQRRMLHWYYKQGRKSDRPTEHEVVAYMVLPMLLSLGWSEQLLAVEWHKVDLAAFRQTPTVAKDCVLVCETKGLYHGLQGTLEQAVRYVEKLRLVNCRKIMLTQGGRFYVYGKSSTGAKAQWDDKPVGYLNVEKIRRRCLFPPGTDAIETIMSLTPAGMLEP